MSRQTQFTCDFCGKQSTYAKDWQKVLISKRGNFSVIKFEELISEPKEEADACKPECAASGLYRFLHYGSLSEDVQAAKS